MKDVARAAHVSRTTVSYAYSNSPKISSVARAHVYAVADSIGYRGPSVFGSSLRSGSVGAVGVMVAVSLADALEDPSTTMSMQGIVEVNELADVALTLLPSIASADLSTTRAPVLRGLVDGVVIHDVPESHSMIAMIIAARLPAVAIDSPRVRGLPYVGIDDRAAAYRQMAHILGLGHRAIAVVTNPLSGTPTGGRVDCARIRAAPDSVVRNRLQGYCDAMVEFGMAPTDLHIVEARGIDRASGVTAAYDVLDRGECTAVVATSDVHAIAAISAIRARGGTVPADVSVIGFDDAPVAELLQLTTIRQPVVEKGRIAASMLLDAIAGLGPTETIVPTELVIRASTDVPGSGSARFRGR